jgi:diadenosine tetraphosphate (Ap4A) HIT family hydrolase
MTIEKIPSCPMCSRWEDDAELRIVEFEYSYLILNRDQYFPGYCLLFAKQHLTELFDLDLKTRQGMMEEVTRTAAALAGLFKPDKINYELLGNMVPHIHWHLVPRFSSEPLWPRPIWSEPHAETCLSKEGYRQRCEEICQALENR